MTTDELNTLRIEVAERMGWKNLGKFHDQGMGYWRGRPPKELHHRDLPAYNTDHNAAFTLVTALAMEGWNFTAECYPDGTCYVSFWKDTVIKKDEEHSAHADTLPVAICLAFKEVKQSK